jgi:hypothetical protein
MSTTQAPFFQFCKAIVSGRAADVEELLQQGLDVNTVGPYLPQDEVHRAALLLLLKKKDELRTVFFAVLFGSRRAAGRCPRSRARAVRGFRLFSMFLFFLSSQLSRTRRSVE